MDYKYIEQLLDCYFEAKSSLEEEQILRAFFAQEDIPAHLRQYQDLFRTQMFDKNTECLGSDFDDRILQMIEPKAAEEPATTRRTFSLKPLWRAVACIAVVLALGQAAQMPYTDSEQEHHEQIARTLEMLQKVQQDQNSVAQGDSIVEHTNTLN